MLDSEILGEPLCELLDKWSIVGEPSILEYPIDIFIVFFLVWEIGLSNIYFHTRGLKERRLIHFR